MNLFYSGHHTKALNFWLLVLRIAIGIFMLTHGWPKFVDLINGRTAFADPLHIGSTNSLILTVFAEVVCSILLIFGLGTRLAAFVLIINMAVIVFVVQANAPFAKKEFALLYLLVYLTIFVLGSGRFAVDALMGKKRR